VSESCEPCTPSAAGPAAGPGRRVLRLCWRGFRWGVRCGYVVIALATYSLFHLASVGLPDFLKEPLLARVRAQGLELDFVRIRFIPLRGIVADQVNVRLPGEPDRRLLYFREFALRFDWSPLLALTPPRLSAVSFSDGEAARVVEGAPGEPVAVLRLTQVAGALEFPSDDEWRLTWLDAALNGTHLEAMGALKHATLLRSRSSPSPRRSPDFQSSHLARALNHLDRMTFAEPPKVDLQFAVDGEQLQGSVIQMRFGTSGVRSEYGEFDELRLSVNLQPDRTHPGHSHGVLHLDSAAARSRWGALDSLAFRGDVVFVPTNPWPRSVRWSLGADSLSQELGRLERFRLSGMTEAAGPDHDPDAIPAGLDPERQIARRERPAGMGFATDLNLSAVEYRSRWGAVSNLVLSAHLWNAAGEWKPRAADGLLVADETVTDHGRARRLELRGSVLPVVPSHQPALSGVWTPWAPWRVHARLNTREVQLAPDRSAERLQLRLDWEEGVLRVGDLEAGLDAGSLAGSGVLHALSGEADVEVHGALEPLRLEPLLPPSAWSTVTSLGLQGGSRLNVDARAAFSIPAPLTHLAALPDRMESTLQASGAVWSTNLGLGDLAFSEVRIPVVWTPGGVRIEDMRWQRPPQELHVTAEALPKEGRWHAQLGGRVDPVDLEPLIGSPGLSRQLSLIQLSEPPAISGELWGDWKDPSQLGASLKVALTNATYRGEPITELRTALTYTNRQLVFNGTEIQQGTNEVRASVLHYDIPAQLLYVTNGFSTLDVASLARAIGPKTAKVLSPYEFVEAPTVRINGAIPVSDDAEGDVEFQARMPRFHWWYFRFNDLLATVRWTGDQITLTNVAGGFYGGLLSAEVGVNVANREDTVFRFNASYAEVDLSRLMADLTTRSNRLEGVLSGEVSVQEGHGNHDRPWTGYGNAQLRNGYLWDLPLFGLLSPAFESVSPGLGSAKFRDGNALFAITNRAVNFRRVELLSPAMRLQMDGEVDFTGNLRMVLEAEPLRDLPLVGPLVNLVLSPVTKLMEYDITGTLETPEAELRHVPSFLLIPLQPFHTLKSVFKASDPPARKPAPTRP
ncbi:MAG: hypothetical protein KIT22_06350, partial [Verrucomicrobiae bacterium]|nr:hypothetical protein [Verrucomicrobiae bacterium]